MTELSRYRDDMAKCSHCGLCQAACPVYLEDLLQTHTARARVDLIRVCLLEERLPVSKRLKEVVDRCLLCTNCTQTCAAGIPLDDIIQAAREHLYRGKRRGPARRAAMRRLMERRGPGPILGRVAAAAGRMGLVPEDLPDPRGRTFDARFKESRIKAEGDVRARVVYFVGCATNSLYPETGEDVVRVLTRNGIEVLLPDGVACCGMPALSDGDTATAREMMRANVQALSGLEADAIVTDCTSCGMMLKEKALKVFPDEAPDRSKAQRLAGKVWEVTDYVRHMGLTEDPEAPVEGEVEYTYHVPCHRGWKAGMADAPRELLARIPGSRLKEMEYPEACCGAGGAFFLESRELARNIRARKIRDIKDTGTRIVVTQCPACRSFLQASLPEAEIVHPMQLLARTCAWR